jgi:hypothetical protein
MSVISKPPVAPLSAGVTAALDAIWGTAELGVTGTGIGALSIPFLSFIIFVVCTTAVTLIQRFVEKDNFGTALAKGFVMGVFAGVPYFFGGTAAGALLLGWAGLHGLSGGKDDKKQLPPGQS